MNQHTKQGAIMSSCHSPACSRRVADGSRYCDKCKAVRTDTSGPHSKDADTDPRRLRSTTAWTKFARYILMTNPLCCDPFNEHNGPVVARHVHHINPLSTHPERLLDPDNVASLCIPCHSRIEGMHRSGRHTAHYFLPHSRHILPSAKS